MEGLHDSGSTRASAVSLAADLKDDFYSKLVDDFCGEHDGDLLDQTPWRNRTLVQIGLMREEQDISWVALIQWLQKVLPMHMTADFRCLIERSIMTALSLSGDARKHFFESDVNFDFVGPVCDSIGITRQDLLELSDFSERAKLTGLTNGLILELTDFISREKLKPIVLVSWVRNFLPFFCQDGKAEKAHRQLKKSLRNFRIQYRSNQSSRKRSNGVLDEFLQSPFVIVAEDDPVKFKKACVKDKTRLKAKRCYGGNKPKGEVEEEESDFYATPDQERSENSPRSHEEATDMEEDSKTDTGDCTTLLDLTVLSRQKLAESFGDASEATLEASRDLLRNHFSAMMKQEAALRSLNDHVEAWSKESSHRLMPPLHFLQHMSEFFFQLVRDVERRMMLIEKDVANTLGQKIGRDKLPAFRSLLGFEESAVSRYVQMACEVLCPSEETFPAVRRHWLAFCLERNSPSRLPVHRSNRFINYFEAAAGLVHHHEDVALFFSSLKVLDDPPNIVLESLSADASDEVLRALTCVVAIIYLKVLGPVWQLLKSDGEYPLFSRYLVCLHEKLLEWSADASPVLKPEPFVNVFLQEPMQEKTFHGVFAYCQANAQSLFGSLLKGSLQKVMTVLAAVLEDNLKTFLPGGEFSRDVPVGMKARMADCRFAMLMEEFPFGHSYPYKHNRPDHSVSSSQEMVSTEARPGPVSQKDVGEPESSTDTETWPKPRQRARREDSAFRESIIDGVTEHGGPCKSKQDVEQLLMKLKDLPRAKTRDAIRLQLNYQRIVMGHTDRRLDHIGFSLKNMVTNLIGVLSSQSVPAEESTAANPVARNQADLPSSDQPSDESGLEKPAEGLTTQSV